MEGRSGLNMAPTQYVDQVIELYRLAHTTAPYYHPRVRRSTAPSVAAAVEDLTAFFLAENLGNQYEYWVNQPVRVEGRKQPVYPDIAVVCGQVLRHIVDVKMDLGWQRDEFLPECGKKRDRIRELRAVGTVRASNNKRVRVARRCRYHLVVVSGTNFPELDACRTKVKRLEPDFYVYVLTDGIHPNNPEVRRGRKYPRVKEREFHRLLRRVAH